MLETILKAIEQLPEKDQQEFLALVEEYNNTKNAEDARARFLNFVKYMWPNFIEGAHHKIVADLFDEVLDGDERRVIINMPPRHSKSEFASIFLPAYFLGRWPDKKIIQASNTAELAMTFGRKVRDLVASPAYQGLFPEVSLSADSKAAGRWSTNKGGEYFAAGAGGTISGRGADLFVMDDPHSEQEQVIGEHHPEVYNRVVEWYESGPRLRLQPDASIIVVMTRWHNRDLTGQLVKKMQENPEADQWKVIELPAIMPSGEPMWPEFWPKEELLRTKSSIPISKWSAMYQQNPTSEEGALIKRTYWRNWEEPKPPKCNIILQAWDTAYTKSTRADYSACTTWGVFWNEDDGRNQLILMDAIRGKWDFPELKQVAKNHYREWSPDVCLIEARAAGQSLIDEMRRMDMPVTDWIVGRGTKHNPNDKIFRTNSITDIFASGNVWAPLVKTWAQEVVEECAAFPAGEHDDYLDTVIMAVSRFRQGGWVLTENDEWEEYKPRPVRRYY